MQNSSSSNSKSILDYDPFGMLLVGRHSTTTSAYRYGFNGKENDDETYGNNNAIDFGARIYDPRLGRWLSVDPAQKEYVHTAPYVFALNMPIVFIDPDGKRIYYAGGATFDPNKDYGGKGNFHTKYLKAIDYITNGNYHVMTTDRMDDGIEASHWSELHASLRLTESELQNPDNQNVMNAVVEIKNDIHDIDDPTEPINLIGSSYGSVVMAQAALVLADGGTYITSITLTGSPISKDSKLYQDLMNNPNIGEVIYVDEEGDPVVGSGGTSPEEGEEAFNKFKRNPVAVMKHLYYGKDKNNQRLRKVLNRQLVEKSVEGKEAKENAQQVISEIDSE